MHIYAIFPDNVVPEPVAYAGTLMDAQAKGKTASGPATFWPDVLIELHDIPADKAGLLHVLNGGDPLPSPPLRTWTLTRRGGMKEITP